MFCDKKGEKKLHLPENHSPPPRLILISHALCCTSSSFLSLSFSLFLSLSLWKRNAKHTCDDFDASILVVL